MFRPVGETPTHNKKEKYHAAAGYNCFCLKSYRVEHLTQRLINDIFPNNVRFLEKRKMGTKERRDRERQELRQAILMASRDIAAREGWQSVSIRKVAERIEYSPPTIYEHFTSKEALLRELMREGFRLLMERVRAGNSTAASPEARIMAIALAYWDFAWDYPELYQVMHGLGGVPFCFDAAIVALTMAGRIDGGRVQAAGLVQRAVRAFLAAQRVTN